MHRAARRYGLVVLVAVLHVNVLASPIAQQLAPITDSGGSAVSFPFYPGAENGGSCAARWSPTGSTS